MAQLISPIDGSVYAERPHAGLQQLEIAVMRAEEAQVAWASASLEARCAVIRRAYARLEEQAATLAEGLARQIGRPVVQAPGELARAGERARALCDLAALALEDIQVRDGARIRLEPVGVVLVISPWNYPYLTVTNAVVPALAAGNAVLLKPSFQAALAAESLAEAFLAAGLPAGLLQVLHADDPTALAAVRHPAIGHVVFTGSVAVGRLIASAAAPRAVPLTLELGGKDAAYVRADADLDHAAAQLADGAFFNSGQSCCGVERIYVHRSQFKGFVDRMVSQAQALKLGSPLDPATTLGPMARASGAAEVQRHIAQAVAHGARAWLPAPEPLGPAYMAPQVLTEVHHGMAVMAEETFGPVVGIMPVDDDDEAVARVNDSAFGLTASVWTDDQAAAERLSRRLNVGTVYRNRCDYLDPLLPWTGRKASGLGLSLSHLAYQSFTRTKSLLL